MSKSDKNEPRLSKISINSKPLNMLPKYSIIPKLPKNDPLLKYIKEAGKNDRRQ